MAWTYTQASHNSGWSDKTTHIVWMNHWSVTEQSPDPSYPGSIKLRVSVVTESYSVSPSSYVSPVSDTISYAGTSIAVHSGTLTPASHNYTYTQDVYISAGRASASSAAPSGTLRARSAPRTGISAAPSPSRSRGRSPARRTPSPSPAAG